MDLTGIKMEEKGPWQNYWSSS